uniref:protein PHYTOCHROME-DEPENDENT LATE-FLOWERING-like n=1 Tax=Erigeron canadensis TaxID=72917 RepID=UPI001CB946FD|nr:protein PHYTOCHROME-DEPENDENT LATE-FLOWERING-like [Erigeron canadensis]
MEVAEMRILRWTCGKILSGRIPTGVLRAELEVWTVINKLRGGRFRWFGHVRRRDQTTPLRRAESIHVDDIRRKGRPKMRWEKRLVKDLKELGLLENLTDGLARRSGHNKGESMIHRASPGEEIDLTVDEDGFVAKTLEAQVSFILNIFPDGYFIELPYESNDRHPNIVQDDLKILHPYDRRSESLIAAIECGQIPADFLDDIPCKYINGAVVCEVRDYRKKSSESGYYGSSTASYPSITKVSLKMSLDEVVKDIREISDSSWGYGDLIEAESRILNALHPVLCLDPTPNLDRLCKEPTSIKLNLDIRGMRLKRLRQTSRAATMPENTNLRVGHLRQIIGQPDFVNLADENVGQSNMRPGRPKEHAPSSFIPEPPQMSHQSHNQIVVSNSRYMQDDSARGSSDGISPIIPSMSNLNKICRSNTMALDDNKSQTDSISAPSSCLKNKLLQRQSTVLKQMFDGSPNNDSGGMEFTAEQKKIRCSMKQELADTDRAVKIDPSQVQKRLPQHWTRSIYCRDSWNNMCQPVENNTIIGEEFSGGSIGMHFGAAAGSSQGGKMASMRGQKGMRYNLIEETVESGRIDISEPIQVQKRLPQHFTRSNDSQAQWNNIGQSLDKNSIIQEDNNQRRKSTQSFSSLNSGKLTNGSMGEQVGVAVGSSQREKPVVNAMCDDTRSLTCSFNELMHPAQMSSNWRSESNSNTPDFNVGNRTLRDRFSIIQKLATRSKLECRNNKSDTRKDENSQKTSFPALQLIDVLVSDPNSDTCKDETCTMLLSESLVSGNINICKTRILNFVKDEGHLPGDVLSVVPEFQIRLMLSERESGYAVAMHYGELDDYDYLVEEELISTLPNTHSADLLAVQYCSLMLREGYHLESDHFKPKPMNMVPTPGTLPNTNYGAGQFHEGVSGQSTNEVARQGTSHQNIPNARMHAQGSRVLLPSRSQENEPQPSTYQQQPLQRSLVMMLASNPISMEQDTTMQQQLDNHNRVSSPQYQLLQQQQQSSMQGEKMTGSGSIGSMGWYIGENSSFGVQGFSDVMRMDGGTHAGTAVVSPMMGQNTTSINHGSPINSAINQQLHSDFAIMDTKPRVSVSKPNVLSEQSSHVGGLQGVVRQIHQGSGLSGVPQLVSGSANLETEPTQSRPKFLSVPWGASYNIYTSGSSGFLILDSSINRAKDMNLMQGNGMAPPRLMSGINQNQNLFMNQQQVLLPSTSNLQPVIWPTKQRSPSPFVGMPQQQAPHQPIPVSPQISYGWICPPMSAGNQEGTSTQLNSPNFASVGNNLPNFLM